MRWVIFGGFNDQVGQVLTSYRSDTGTQRPLAVPGFVRKSGRMLPRGQGRGSGYL